MGQMIVHVNDGHDEQSGVVYVNMYICEENEIITHIV